ncbi:hypothetical protein B0H94_10722 [Salsuginibacillus halophilus]|uniref:Uncharacterized protein n=1 Tax=Salsuginibacillus halophilus TaxID=517424 RepID=A0A2P8HFL9_9BACI|nr:YqzL family protein [Salsuginibacillus halophilus]PSL45017.1 hypothetical protein B0H94_10722 [Salsuginibacillus halophilus]
MEIPDWTMFERTGRVDVYLDLKEAETSDGSQNSQHETEVSGELQVELPE